MPLYDVTIFLVGGAMAKINQKQDNSTKMFELIKNQIEQEEFVLNSETETAQLTIKYPAINIIGYFIDER
jgi:hypothetical protein